MAKNFNENVLICGLCNTWFNVPRTLNCLHSFCENCLSKQIIKSVTNTNQTKKGDKASLTEFPCPSCRKTITSKEFSTLPPNRWTEAFPINTFLMDLVDIELLKRGKKTCGPCSRNGDKSPVASWCKECRDGLCQNCAKVHKGMRVSMKHKVLSLEDFMKQAALLKEEQEPCLKHAGKTLDMYCMTDKELCCPNCVAEEHRRCDRVVPVSEAAKKNANDKDFLVKSLTEYKQHITKLATDRKGQVETLDKQKAKLSEEFATVKKNVINLLDKLQNAMNAELSRVHASEVKEIKGELEKCNGVLAAVTNANELYKVTDIHGSDSRMLNTLEQIRRECQWYEEDMGKLRSHMRDGELDFELDANIQVLLNQTKKLGRLSAQHSPSKLPQFPNTVIAETTSDKASMMKSTLSLRGRGRCEHTKTFDAGTQEDSKDCWHTGATFLSDGRLVLVDRTNKKVKVYSKNYRLLHSLYFSSKPWDVTVVNDSEIAVSLPEERGIQLLSLEVGLTVTDYIGTQEGCYGIHYVRGKFVGVCYDGKPPSLKILGSDGKELAVISQDDDGSPLFSRPLYVMANSSGSIIYVADERRGSVMTLTETDEHCYHYSAINLSRAAGLALDTEGNLYVCRNHSKTVQVVAPEGDRVKTLVSNDDVSYPRAIAYNVNDERLIITQGDRNYVKVYQFVS